MSPRLWNPCTKHRSQQPPQTTPSNSWVELTVSSYTHASTHGTPTHTTATPIRPNSAPRGITVHNGERGYTLPGSGKRSHGAAFNMDPLEHTGKFATHLKTTSHEQTTTRRRQAA